MSLRELFIKILNVPYTQVEEDASYYTEKRGRTLYLYFEPSNGEIDWLNNLDFPSRPYRDMKDRWYCHRGFLRVWKALEPHLADCIADKSIREIRITGYSHGGAIALLCHEYCRFHRPDCRTQTYSFGAPRIVWGKPGETVMERFEGYTGVRNGKDIVTHLPPRIWGYRHVGSRLNLADPEHNGPVRAHTPAAYLASLSAMEGITGEKEAPSQKRQYTPVFSAAGDSFR